MTRRPIRALSLVFLLALLILTIFPARRPAEAKASDEKPVVARITAKSPADLDRLVRLGLDLLETRDGDDLFILTTPEEIDRLRADGWAVKVDDEQTAAVSAPVTETFQGGYRTVAEMRAFLDAEAAQYPDLAEVFIYGQSWERVTGGPSAGHDLFGIRLTNRARTGPKPTFFLMAAIHARELSTSELALRFVDHLLSNYGVDGDVTWLLDEHLVVVVPAVNPDGRVLAEQGYLQRKNTDISYGGGCSIPNIGVDLNRNSDFKWGTVDGPNESKCSETYPGPVPASEPETTALRDLIRSLFPDQRGPADTDPAPPTTTGVLLTLHSYGNLVLWPWGWTSTAAPNDADLAAIGCKFAAYNGFTPEQSIGLYPTSGTTDDWAYGELGIAGFTFEVGGSGGTCGGFFPAFSCLDGGSGGSFWPRNLPAFLYAARIARTPYQLGHGPSPESATSATVGDSTEIRARFDDQSNGGQPVAAAEYYLDVPPWSGGTGIPMTPVDGTFNSPSEVATADVGPLTGRHLVFVRGQDSNGAWGPVRGVFNPDPACSSTLLPASQTFASPGGTGTVTVTLPAGCRWTATSNDTWITITGGAGGSGNGTVSYSAASNGSGSPRSATLVIANQNFAVTQTGLQQPDLVEAALADPPAAAPPGGSFAVTDTVQNQGGGSAGSSTTRYYLSLDASKDGADKLLSATRAVPTLAPDATSAGTVIVTVPSNIALGSYLLLACADDTGAVAETDESNNCRASASRVAVGKPDLLETTVANPPATAPPGGTFPATDTILNQGQVGSGPSTTRYYLSLDTAKSNADKLLSGTRSVPALAPGASSAGIVTVTVPSSTAIGAYFLLACADDKSDVAESDETNNCRASASRVTVAWPDLVETAVADPPAVVLPGGSFPATDSVKNQGPVSAGASKTRYYLSLDTSRNSGDKLLSGSRSVPILSPGAISTGTITVTVPTNTVLGGYYLLACADDSTSVDESNEANNCKASANRVAVSRPDLVETSLADPPPSAARGGAFSVSDTVQNSAAVAAGASTTRYYLSLDSSRNSGDIRLTGTRSVPALAPGASSAGAVTVTIPSTVPLATYYVLACADDQTDVTESNETNNCRASVNPVAIGP